MRFYFTKHSFSASDFMEVCTNVVDIPLILNLSDQAIDIETSCVESIPFSPRCE